MFGEPETAYHGGPPARKCNNCRAQIELILWCSDWAYSLCSDWVTVQWDAEEGGWVIPVDEWDGVRDGRKDAGDF